MDPSRQQAGISRTLTLCAMVGAVVALGLPALNVQMEVARRAKCMNNLRAIGAAMHLYANDYRGWLPALSPLVGGSRGKLENGFDRHAALLLNLAYVRSPSAFLCPSDKEDGNPLMPLSGDGSTGHATVRIATGGAPWIPAGNIQWFNISYFYVAGFTIRDREDFLLLADEHWDSEGDCPAECRHDLDPFDNHGKAGRNVLYLNGRADWLAGIRIDEAYEAVQQYGANLRSRTVD